MVVQTTWKDAILYKTIFAEAMYVSEEQEERWNNIDIMINS